VITANGYITLFGTPGYRVLTVGHILKFGITVTAI